MESIKTYISSEFWESEEPESFLQGDHELGEGVSGAIYFETSGSSSMGKVVVHSRETILASAKLVVEWLDVTEEDCWYLALPIHHVGGFGVLARSFVSGCMIVEHQGKWCAKQCVKQMNFTKVTIISLVPTQVYDLVKEQLSAPASLRAVIVGGGKIDAELKVKAIELGWNILETYGMTETGSMIATQRIVLDSAIELIDQWQARVNSQGLLEIKGSGLMKGYAVETHEGYKLQKPFKNGWFTTSDRVDLIENKLIFRGRNDRVVKVLGELVNLEAFEKELMERVPFKVNIIDLSDERRGAILIPVVESEDQNDEMIAHFLMSSLPKGPKQLSESYICPHLPRTQMGKLDRQSLRDSIVKFRKST